MPRSFVIVSHVSSSVERKQKRVPPVCPLNGVFVQRWPEDGCRLLSEPTVLECLEVKLRGAIKSTMRLHKFLCIRRNLVVVIK